MFSGEKSQKAKTKLTAKLARLSASSSELAEQMLKVDSSSRRPAAVASFSPICLWPSTTVERHESDPPTAGFAIDSATTSWYPGKSIAACTSSVSVGNATNNGGETGNQLPLLFVVIARRRQMQHQ